MEKKYEREVENMEICTEVTFRVGQHNVKVIQSIKNANEPKYDVFIERDAMFAGVDALVIRQFIDELEEVLGW